MIMMLSVCAGKWRRMRDLNPRAAIKPNTISNSGFGCPRGFVAGIRARQRNDRNSGESLNGLELRRELRLGGV